MVVVVVGGGGVYATRLKFRVVCRLAIHRGRLLLLWRSSFPSTTTVGNGSSSRSCNIRFRHVVVVVAVSTT